MKYQEWLNGCGCCPDIQDCPPSTGNPCDCDSILLELSKQHTDDLVLQDEIDNLDEKKLDASAYTPVDLTDYYTKEEVDELIPSLDGYATEEWVNEQGFLKTVEPLKTINGESLIGEGDIVISGGSGDAYTKAETDALLNDKQDKLTAGSGISISYNNVISVTGGGESSGATSGEVMDMISGYTYDKDTIDNKIAGGGTFDPTLYYKKSETSGKTEIQNALGLKLDASAFTESDYYKKSETSGKTELDAEFDKYYEKDETSGKTELSNEFALYYKKSETSSKTEIDDALDLKQNVLSAGTGISITNNVISTSGSVTEIDAPCDDIFGNALYIVQYGGNNPGPKMIAQGVDGIITGSDGVTPAHCKDIRPDWNVIQKKLTAGTGIDITNNVISATGGGASYSAGTGIDITNNIISSTLNAYNGTGVGSLIIGQSANTASGDYSVAVGAQTEALGGRSFAQGLSGKTTNTAEITFGQLNDTKNAYAGFGHSGNTLFTVGNGAGIDGSTTDYARHNAFEVRSNGDIYIPEPSKVNPSHYYQAPMIKLQDRLNEIDNKPNIWCGDSQAWSQISGSTQQNTLYLVY